MPSREQVVEKAARIFGAARLAEVLAVLDEYGIEEWQRERERVQMGILRLCDTGGAAAAEAGGDWDELRRYVKAAQSDYRDILLWAEYPHRAAFPAGAAQTDPAGYKAAAKADVGEYLAWLHAGSPHP